MQGAWLRLLIALSGVSHELGAVPVYLGYLFVGGALLNESGMEKRIR